MDEITRILLFGGIIVTVISGMVILINAFIDSIGKGLACLLVPFYVLYYISKKWNQLKIVTLIYFSGLLLIFAGFITSATTALSPYSSISEARTTNSSVQIRGKYVQNSGIFDIEKNLFVFTLDSDGEKCQVFYDGPKPSNFDTANDIVVLGKFKDGKLYAKDLLTKCPSKYQKSEY